MYSTDFHLDEEGDRTYTCANSFNKKNLLDNVVDAIEWLISMDHLDNKYLIDKGGEK